MSKHKLEPCGLPAQNYLRSFWLSQPTALQHHRSTPGLPATVDLIIIGSGITGTLTAYNLLQRQPGMKILMLEAREVCGGATGRNGGQIKTDPYIAYEGFKARVGAEQANEMLRFESSHLPYYADLLAREQIKCDFHITTAYDVCLNPKMAEIGRRGYQARLKDFPEDMKAFLELDDPEHLQRLSQVKGALWGCAYKVGSIHPYKLVNGLLRACLRKESFNLQTDTPVTSLSHTGSQWKVDTPRGTVEAAKVVVCTNGYMSNLLPQFANKIVPIKGPCSALAIPPPQPLTIPSNQRFRPLFTTYSLKNDVHDFDYMISRQEEPNHIVVGGGHEAFEHRPGEWYGNADDSTQMYVMAISRSAQAKDSDGTERYFLDFMPKHFINYPERESRLAHLWTGIMGLSSDGIPWVGPVPDQPHGLYMLGGFHGRGMVRSPGSVRAVTELILTDAPIEKSAEILVKAGLPRAFLFDKERLDDDTNILTESFEAHGTSEGGAMDKVKAKL